jgi:cbb3-type cytochrome c oxidase subunit III
MGGDDDVTTWQRIFCTAVTSCMALLGIVLFGYQTGLAAPGDAVSGEKLFQAHCYACHGLKGRGDGVAAQHLQTKPRSLTDHRVMSKRTDEQLFDAIRHRGSGAHGSLAMPDWGEHLQAKEVWDLIAYVRTLHRQPARRGVAARGAATFTRYCWTCHGPSGQGNGVFTTLYDPPPPDFTDPKRQAQLTDVQLYQIISQGGAAVKRTAAMPAWGHLLTASEIHDLIAYIRHLASKP